MPQPGSLIEDVNRATGQRARPGNQAFGRLSGLFWVPFGLVYAIFDYFTPFWDLLDPFSAVLDPFGPFWTLLDPFGKQKY